MATNGPEAIFLQRVYIPRCNKRHTELEEKVFELHNFYPDKERFKTKLNEYISSKIKAPEQRAQIRRKLIIFSLGLSSTLFWDLYAVFKQEMVFEDYVCQAQSGPNKGKSALWYLAWYAAFHPSQDLLFVCEKFQDKLEADHFLQEIEGSVFALWWIAQAAGNGKPTVFLFLMNTLKIPVENLFVTATSGRFNGKSLLWFLAQAAYRGYPQAFEIVWEQCENNIDIEELTRQAETEPGQGLSPLWFLAAMARKEKTGLFFSVWDSIVDEGIPDRVIEAAPTQGEDANCSLLSIIKTHFPQMLKENEKALEETMAGLYLDPPPPSASRRLSM